MFACVTTIDYLLEGLFAGFLCLYPRVFGTVAGGLFVIFGFASGSVLASTSSTPSTCLCISLTFPFSLTFTFYFSFRLDNNVVENVTVHNV